MVSLAEKPVASDKPQEFRVPKNREEYFFPRKKTHDELQQGHLELSNDLGPDSFVRTFEVNVPRNLFQHAGVPWEITDALWSRDYPDGNVPEEEVNRDIEVEVSRDMLSFGFRPDNIKFSLIFNTQGRLFGISIRKFDSKSDFANPHMVGAALDFVDKWEDDPEWGDEQREHNRHEKRYDYDKPEMILHHNRIAKSMLNAYEFIREEGYIPR